MEGVVLQALLYILLLLVALGLVVWVAKAVLAQIGAPPVMFTIVTAVACIIVLIVIAGLLGAPIGILR